MLVGLNQIYTFLNNVHENLIDFQGDFMKKNPLWC